MQEAQIKHIKNNLPELVEKTTCSSAFIEMFRSRKVLEPSQVTSLESPDLTPPGKCKRFYEILAKTNQRGSFDLLITSLEATQQTEALKLLLDCRIFGYYGTISYEKSKVLRAGGFNGEKIYKGKFGERDAAVKVVSPDTTEIKMTLREVDMLTTLDEHENILRYFIVELKDDFIQTAMDLFEITLQDAVKLNRDNMSAIKTLTECTSGLVYIHSMRVIHTDLNPANVFLKDNGQVKISNFGLAQQFTADEGSILVYSENVRDKDWMAPEILKHFIEEETDTHLIKMTPACDVFSLGCIFYFVLTKGAHPFGNPVLRQSNIYYDRPQVKNSSLAPDLLARISRMVSHKLEKRPSTRDVLMDDCYITGDLSSSTSYRNVVPASPEHEDNPVYMEEPASVEQDLSSPELALNVNAASTPVSTPSVLEEIHRPVSVAKRSLPVKPHSSFQSSCFRRTSKRRKTNLQNSTDTDTEMPNTIKVEEHDYVDGAGNNALFQAVLKGEKLQEIKRIVDNGTDINWKNTAGESILHLAMNHKDSEVVNFFSTAVGDVNLKDKSGESPIHKLRNVQTNFQEKLTMLIAKKADINAVDTNGNTILGLAASSGRSRADLEFIISKSGKWKHKNKKGETVLHLAVDGGNIEAVKYLIEVGSPSPILKDTKGETPLHRIRYAKKNFKQIMNAILDKGACINAIDRNGNSVLALAAQAGRSRKDLEYIVEKDGDVNAKNRTEQSILHLAAKGGNPEAIKYLVELGSSVNSKDKIGDTPLHHIALTKLNFMASLEALLDNGANISQQNEIGNTLLGLSTIQGRSTADLKYIVEKGGEWKLKNKRGESVLHFAAKSGNIEAIQYFVTLRHPIDSKCNKGMLPLHCTVHNKVNFKETVDVLLTCGASIDATDKDGNSLLGLAALEGKPKEILDYLISRNADKEKVNVQGRTILHLAAKGGNFEAIKYLIELGGNVEATDKDGCIPLHYISNVKPTFKKCLDTFLEHGTNINVKNKKGCTLLDLVCKGDWEEAVLDYVVQKGGSGTLYDGFI